jgi:hydrophobe/amphiphile efflux-3 (HAE3) family protein
MPTNPTVKRLSGERMDSVFEYIGKEISRRPGSILAIVAVILFCSLIGTTFITMESGTSTYIDKDTPRGMLLDSYTQNFQSDSLMLIIESDDVLSPDTLAYMDRLAGQVRRQPHVTGTSGLVDLVKQGNGGVLPTSTAEIAQAESQVPSELLIRYVPSKLMTIMVVELEPGVSSTVQQSIVSGLDSVIAISSPPAGISVTVSGNPAFQQQLMQEMGSSMGMLIMIAMVLMVIAVGIFFSHVRYRLLSVAIVASGLVLTFGIIGFAGIAISMVVISAFPVLIGIGIDYAIQFHSRFDEESKRSPLPRAVMTTVTKAGPSILYAMLATSLGFVAMMISPVPMIRTFGLVCVIGVGCCYLAALIIVPAFGMFMKYRPVQNNAENGGKQTRSEQYNCAIGSLAEKIAKNAIPVFVVCALIGFIGFQMDGEILVNTDEKTFVPSDMPAVIDLNKVTRTMGSTSTLPVYVRGDTVVSLDVIRWIDEFQQYELESNPKMTGARSIVNLIREYNGGKVPGSDTEIAGVLEKIPAGDKIRYLSGSNEAVIEFSTVKMENQVAMSNVNLVKNDLLWKKPPVGVTADTTGQAAMFSALIREISDGKMQMTILAFVLIFSFLLLVYRRVTRAVTPLIPIMMLVGWNGLIMYVLGIDYTPMTAVLGSMTIGVASEYTIVIMERFYEEREAGLSLMGAICHANRQIGAAISVSGMATVFGFAALIFSRFNMISNFGLVTVLTVGCSLIGAIIVMPAVLILIGRLGRGKERNKTPVSGQCTD